MTASGTTLPARRSRPDLTVFVGTTDRLTTLERTVASYARMTLPHELVIVDNGTIHPDCLALLGRMEHDGHVKRVYHLPPCDDLFAVARNFNRAIEAEFDHGSGAPWFAVTDADICFDGTSPDALDVYVQVAKGLGRATGPHLRVDAHIPRGYPLRSRVLACETWMLYADEMEWFPGWSGEGEPVDVPWSSTQIDTTFHLFPRRRFFDRLHMDTVRVGPPYDAMHLDWYVDVFNPVPENAIYVGGERKVGSWGKQWIRDYWFWFQEYGPERAWELLEQQPMNLGDLCNISMTRSWCLQYGVGVEADHAKSVDWLRSAIPHPNPRYWDREDDWMNFVYRDDMSALGWSATEKVAA